jgi:cytochrome c oxidase subunit 1
VHNFDEIHAVTHLDDWWHEKYREDENHRLVRNPNARPWATPEGPAEPPHLPSPSYWPIVLALGLPFIAYGLLYTYWLAAVGGLLVIVAIYGWSLEPSVDPAAGHHGHDDDHDDHGGGDGDSHGAEAEPELVGATPEGGE